MDRTECKINREIRALADLLQAEVNAVPDQQKEAGLFNLLGLILSRSVAKETNILSKSLSGFAVMRLTLKAFSF